MESVVAHPWTLAGEAGRPWVMLVGTGAVLPGPHPAACVPVTGECSSFSSGAAELQGLGAGARGAVLAARAAATRPCRLLFARDGFSFKPCVPPPQLRSARSWRRDQRD